MSIQTSLLLKILPHGTIRFSPVVATAVRFPIASISSALTRFESEGALR